MPLGGSDPKATALAFLGINLGSKNIRTLRKEDIDDAFTRQLHISEYTPENVVHPPRVKSKYEYQRLLHESYQYISKVLIEEQQKAEEEERRKAETEGTKERKHLFTNVKKLQRLNAMKGRNPF